ncbi:hypothetical protein, partial [Shewanella sp.]|uniref:hypothetical protein n=1 Tax=Shewanella sp. TaxID=50422 RepID=UPI003D12AC9D
MLKTQGFKVKSVRLGVTTYDLLIDNKTESNVFTVIIGKNGCGKSRILKQISTSFAVSDQLLRESPSSWSDICNEKDM